MVSFAVVLAQLVMGVAVAETPTSYPLDIPSQSLNDALQALALASKHELLYSARLVEGKRGVALKGTFTAEEAVRQLLAGTELTYEVTGEGVVVIKKSPAPTPAVSSSSEKGDEGRVRIAQLDKPDTRSSSSEERSVRNPFSSVETEGGKVDEVVVTGTHIRGVRQDFSPITVYDRAAIAVSGAGTIEEFMRKIPQNFAMVDGTTFLTAGSHPQALQNNSRGAAVDLRGLGVGTTLVLVNGNRVSPSGADGSFVDISMIPISAVDRIDVMTDGASAIYGSDAVGGVVNFILKESYSDAESRLRFGAAQGGGEETTLAQTLGHAWTAGSAFLTYEYHNQDKLLSEKRQYLADQGGEFDLLPDQRRHSALAATTHRLSDTTKISADSLFSYREFSQAFNIPGFFTQFEEGEAQQVSFHAGIDQSIAMDWSANLSVGYSRTADGRRINIPTIGFALRQDIDSDLRSAELKLDGPVSFLWPDAKASLGFGVRREGFKFGEDEFVRDVRSAYGELLLPLVHSGKELPWADRLEASVAARYDHYDGVGSSTEPKIGLLWSPGSAIKVRTTFASAFRAPLLTELSTFEGYSLWAAPDPAAHDGTTILLVRDGSGNPDLQPEESKSFTFGVDFRPSAAHDVTVSATYFNIDFRDRIRRPPLLALNPENVFIQQNAEALAPYVERNPGAGGVQTIFESYDVIDYTGDVDPDNPEPQDVEAIYDARLQNVARTRAEGIEFGGNAVVDTDIGRVGVSVSADYLMQLEARSADTSPTIVEVDRIYNPPDLKGRATVSWSRGAYTSIISANYTDSYRNNIFIPSRDVGSWTTLDGQIQYAPRTKNAVVSNCTLYLDVQNITNERAPFAENSSLIGDLGFDATNASARGRSFSVQWVKSW